MCCTVYVWISSRSQAAEVVASTSAAFPDTAIQNVMKAYQISFAHYVWVVPEGEDEPCVDRYGVTCSQDGAEVGRG